MILAHGKVNVARMCAKIGRIKEKLKLKNIIRKLTMNVVPYIILTLFSLVSPLKVFILIRQ